MIINAADYEKDLRRIVDEAFSSAPMDCVVLVNGKERGQRGDDAPADFVFRVLSGFAHLNNQASISHGAGWVEQTISAFTCRCEVEGGKQGTLPLPADKRMRMLEHVYITHNKQKLTMSKGKPVCLPFLI